MLPFSSFSYAVLTCSAVYCTFVPCTACTLPVCTGTFHICLRLHFFSLGFFIFSTRFLICTFCYFTILYVTCYVFISSTQIFIHFFFLFYIFSTCYYPPYVPSMPCTVCTIPVCTGAFHIRVYLHFFSFGFFFYFFHSLP